MISFKIIQSNDYEIINQTYTFYQNLIYLGHSQGHFYIKDPLVIDNHLMLEVIDNDLYIHPHAKVEFFLVDGKRSTSIKKIKPNQIITIGSTQIEILKFNQTELLLRKEILDIKLKQMIDNQDPRLTVIEELSGLIKP